MAATKKQVDILNVLDDGICEDQDWDESCLHQWGDSAYFFEKYKPLPKGTWLIHFTPNPDSIIKNGFNGADVRWLGLTKGGGPRKPGKHALAYQVKRLANSNSGNYGNDAILFQSDDAVEAFHKSDGEWQVIFPIDTVTNSIALIKKDAKTFTAKTPNGDQQVAKDKLAIFIKGLSKAKVKAQTSFLAKVAEKYIV